MDFCLSRHMPSTNTNSSLLDNFYETDRLPDGSEQCLRFTGLLSQAFSAFASVAAIFSVLGLVYWKLRHYGRFKKMPPGPKGQWLTGNKTDIPRIKPWIRFKEWTDYYGSMVTFWNGPRPTIVLGDAKIANDLLDRRSAIYSSRPRFVVMGELFTNNDALLTMPYGKKWIANRKLFHVGLVKKACDSYQPIQQAESQRLMRDLLVTPELFMRHIERFAASVMVCVGYGNRVDDLNDPVVRRVYDRMGYMATLNVPGAYWAESFPILKHLPEFLAPWKREVKERGAAGTQMLVDLALEVKRQIDDPTQEAPPSFTRTLWEKFYEKPGTITELEIGMATGSLFGAGSDTTSATIQSFVLAMTCFPHTAAKAQEELDRVVGRLRSPTWDDMPNLPYCNAVIKETLRWRPVAVMGGTPHATSRDDYYEGHFIPKGTTIMGNLWAIHHNPKYFRDSHQFIPERYLEGPESFGDGTASYPHRDGHSGFGWGRRICPGKLLAENSLFCVLTKLLWGFNFSKAQDPVSGQVIEPDIFNYTEGFNSRPRDFACDIRPRDPAIVDLITREASEGESFLQMYKPRWKW